MTPPSPDSLEELVSDLCKFSNEKEKEFMHPVIKAIILHFWLAYVHPFNDGNGRTARALLYWYMLKSRYWLFEYMSISRVIVRSRNQYYRSFLYSEIDAGDMTYFIVYHLRAISAAIKELKRYIERKQAELNYATQQWSSYPSLNYRQKDVLKKVRQDKSLTLSLKSHMQRYDVVHQTARTDLLELCDAGLLKKYKQGKIIFLLLPLTSKTSCYQRPSEPEARNWLWSGSYVSENLHNASPSRPTSQRSERPTSHGCFASGDAPRCCLVMHQKSLRP